MTSLADARRALGAAVACAWVASTAAAAPPSLYERLGAEAGINRIARALIQRTSTFHQTARPFEGSNTDRIVTQLAEQLCDLTGGPCDYEGDSVREVHAGHGITQSELYGMVEILQDVMREQGIGLREKNELLSILAPMKRDVVER